MMLAVRQMAAMVIVTIARWIRPIYEETSERLARWFFWMLVSFNVLSLVLFVLPDDAPLLGTTGGSWGLLVVVIGWLCLHALLFGGRSIRALAEEARSRWGLTASQENRIVGVYCAVTAALFFVHFL